MLYQILKIYARVAVRFFFHSIDVNKKEVLKEKGPLLIAANHPNSFLDAIIFDILFDVSVTSLARGDAFKSKRVFKILRALKMLPVYRIREGAENLNTNYETFDACIDIFKQQEGVLIFSEGLCVNEWHLRPLKKGTARLAFQAWEQNIPLKIIPAGINYSSFRKNGKKIIVQFGNMLTYDLFCKAQTDGEKNTLFNKVLKEELQPLVFEITAGDSDALNDEFGNTSIIQKWLLAIPAFMGALLHLPIFILAKLTFKTFFKDTDHHDSILFGILFLGYPLYVLIFSLFVYFISNFYLAISCVILLPLLAYCYSKWYIRK